MKCEAGVKQRNLMKPGFAEYRFVLVDRQNGQMRRHRRSRQSGCREIKLSFVGKCYGPRQPAANLAAFGATMVCHDEGGTRL